MAICLDRPADTTLGGSRDKVTGVAAAGNEAPDARPLYFGPQSRPLFGWYYPAAISSVSAARQAVVLCKPLGYESQCAHPYYRYAAERLAAAGIAVLRFDYDGTGDSYGSDDDPDRVDAWIASIGFAIDELRALSGVSRITLFGVRFGATLALMAASQRGDVDALILWAVCRSGRSYLREMRMLKAAHRGGNTPASDSAPYNPGYEEAAGFYYTAETVATLEGLDATTIVNIPARRALVVGRDDVPVDERLVKQVRSLGTETQSAAWQGYAQMMLDSHQSEIPSPTIDSILDWMASSDEPESRGMPREGVSSSSASATTRLDVAAFSEMPFTSGKDSDTFGILTVPHRRDDAALPIVLLITVGSNLHIGPNRMYVTMARRLAALGYTVLRLDVPGIGDSARGSESSRAHIYSDHAIASVRTIMEDLTRSRGLDKFVLIGLCSGAYTAYNVAKVDPRVAGQVLINPQTYEWKEGDSLDTVFRDSVKLTRYYTAAMLDPLTIRRILFREVDIRRIVRALSRRLGQRVQLLASNLAKIDIRHGSFETDVCRHFRKILSRGTETLFLFADDDFGIEATEIHLGPKVKKLRGYNCVRYDTISGADHTFTPKRSREVMIECVESFIRARFSAEPKKDGKQPA